MPFFVRHSRTVWVTTLVVLLPVLVLTVFASPMYRATAVVVAPPNASPNREAALLRELQRDLPRSSQSAEAAPSPRLRVEWAADRRAALVVEAGLPEYSADTANLWAKKYLAARKGATLAEPAVQPEAPFAPKKARNVGIGAITGLLLGLFFAFLRSLKGDTTKGGRENTNFPAN